MRWAVVAVVVALAAAVTVNALLLGYGVDRNDPVGRLSPVASLPASSTPRPAPPAATTTDDHGPGGHGADD